MTLMKLQEFLDAEKWKDSEKRACDMCGRYVRCRYCVRTEEYPCAMAHNRLVEAQKAPVPDRIPDWLLPEPDILAEFGAETAEEARPAPSAPGAMSMQEAEPVSGAALPAPAEERKRPHVIACGVKGGVRLCALQRRIPTVTSELGA